MMRYYTRIFVSIFIVLANLYSCARKGTYIKPVSELPKPRVIIITPEEKHPTLRPYVINGRRYYPIPRPQGYVEFGKASWYGKEFHGRPTASGQVYNMYELTAAHRTLPMGTYVRVLNLENNKSTVFLGCCALKEVRWRFR